MTFKEMCETIAESKLLAHKDGTPYTPDEIWNYSPTGELLMIPEWYFEALSILERPLTDKEIEFTQQTIREIKENLWNKAQK